MQTSPQGVAFLVAHEGVVPGPYLDSVGVWTLGIGHTAAAGAPIPADMARGMPADLAAALREVFAVFRRDLARYEAEVAAAIGRTPCEQHEFDAAVSFHFNTGAIKRAAWVDLWRRGQKADAARSMLANWRKPTEIISRRTAERDLFLNGDYGAGKATVWGVSKAGRVIWTSQRRLAQGDILALLDAAPGLPPTIGPGSRGDAVRAAQAALAVLGHDPGPVDGHFGARTKSAAIAFQSAAGLVPDGIIGPLSWAALQGD